MIIALLLFSAFFVLPILKEAIKKKIGEKERTNAPGNFVSLSRGVVHYRWFGAETGDLVVCIHGLTTPSFVFEGLASHYANIGKRVLVYDHYGRGYSDRPTAKQDKLFFISQLNELLIKLEIKKKKFELVGYSMGGSIAAAYAANHPDRLSKLILIDASGYAIKAQSTPIAFQLAKIPIIKNLFTYITPKFIARKSVENVYADITKVNDTLVERYFELALRAGNRQAFIDRLSVENDINGSEKIKSITQNTLILWGEKDKLIPTEVALKFHKDLPNNTLVILNGLGHVPMEENPHKSLVPVLEFLRDTNTLD